MRVITEKCPVLNFLVSMVQIISPANGVVTQNT